MRWFLILLEKKKPILQKGRSTSQQAVEDIKELNKPKIAADFYQTFLHVTH